MALALPLGVLAARYQGWLVTLLERAAYLAQSIPGIVVALALVSLTVHSIRPLYQSALLLVIAYAILFLPLALVSVRSALMQAQPAAGGGRALARAGRVAVLVARHPAAGRAWAWGRGGAGVHLRDDGADRDLAAGADRHADAGDADLGGYLHPGLRRGGTLCGGAGGDVDAGLLAAGAALWRGQRVLSPVRWCDGAAGHFAV